MTGDLSFCSSLVFGLRVLDIGVRMCKSKDAEGGPRSNITLRRISTDMYPSSGTEATLSGNDLPKNGDASTRPFG